MKTASDVDPGTRRKAHVLIVTFAFPGHFAPFVQLMYQLDKELPGLTVTVMGNKDRIADLSNLQGKGDLKNLDLRLEEVFGPVPHFPDDPKFPVRVAMVAGNNYKECEPLMRTLAQQKGAPEAPTAIIADMFQYWSKDLADVLGVPWYTYFSTSCTYASGILQVSKMREEGVHPVTSPDLSALLSNFPGLTFLRIRDLPAEILVGFEEFYSEVVDRTRRATAVLINTAEELDEPAGGAKVLRTLVNPETRVLPIGPSLQYPGFGFTYSQPTSTSNCLQWLDTQPASSVLYIAFGSVGVVSSEMNTELAAGLEASGVPFLWVLKLQGSPKLSDALPAGFEERTKGRGLIETGWAPQCQILAHPSIGGFLSHSGWNSTLESIVAGVPIISWPLCAEQFMNSRFISLVAKVGIAICHAKAENQDSFEDVDRDAVEKAVRWLFFGDEGRQVKRNMTELQKLTQIATAEGGSSYRNLHALFAEIVSVQ